MRLDSAYDDVVPAIVLAEGAFGEPAGKTANGVVRHGERFDVRSVVDSTQAGRTTREVLGTGPAVPVVASVSAALEYAPDARALVLGVAPAGGRLPDSWTAAVREAMAAGCDVVSGLHTFLSDDPEWARLAEECDVHVFDVRKPPAVADLRVADGRANDVDADVVLTAGTDCAVGKRTTTFELYRAARSRGLDAGWVATGQTGVMVGANAGVVVDRVPADFAAGVVEDLVCSVADEYDLVFVEGQAALSHRAYAGVTLSLLHGASPDRVVLVDDPARERRDDFEQFPVAGVATERSLVEVHGDTPVVALSTWGDPDEQAGRHALPTANVTHEGGPDRLLDVVVGER